MRVMIEAARFILRKDSDDFKQKRVAVTAPTAVAAKIVEGRTIDSAFQTFNPNRYGVDLMEPSRKGNFDDEWKNLGKLFHGSVGHLPTPPPPTLTLNRVKMSNLGSKHLRRLEIDI